MNESTEVLANINLNTIVNSVLTKFALAIIILLCGFILGRFLGKLLQKILQEMEFNKILKKATGIKVSMDEVIGTLVTYLVYFITIIMALETVEIAPLILYIVMAALLIIIIISLLLSVKDFFPNVVSSLIMHQKDYIAAGDRVKIEGIEGRVKKINLIETTLETDKGDQIFIPNSTITKSKLIKFKE